MALHPHALEGVVVDRLSGRPVPIVLIEAWDHEGKFSEVLGSAVTNKAGAFKLAFDQDLVEKAFAGRSPKFALKVFYKGSRLAFSPSEEEIHLHAHAKPLTLTINIPAAYGGDNIYQHVPPDLRQELDALKKHTNAVVEKLKDEKTRQAFIENPAQVLAEMGVPLSAQLRQRMGQQPPKSVLTPRAFRLLNGQIVTPKINIRFTAEKKENSHGR